MMLRRARKPFWPVLVFVLCCGASIPKAADIISPSEAFFLSLDPELLLNYRGGLLTAFSPDERLRVTFMGRTGDSTRNLVAVDDDGSGYTMVRGDLDIEKVQAPIFTSDTVKSMVMGFILRGQNWNQRDAQTTEIDGYTVIKEEYAPSDRSPDAKNADNVGAFVLLVRKKADQYTDREKRVFAAMGPDMQKSNQFYELVTVVEWRDASLRPKAEATVDLKPAGERSTNSFAIRLMDLDGRWRVAENYAKMVSDVLHALLPSKMSRQRIGSLGSETYYTTEYVSGRSKQVSRTRYYLVKPEAFTAAIGERFNDHIARELDSRNFQITRRQFYEKNAATLAKPLYYLCTASVLANSASQYYAGELKRLQGQTGGTGTGNAGRYGNRAQSISGRDEKTTAEIRREMERLGPRRKLATEYSRSLDGVEKTLILLVLSDNATLPWKDWVRMLESRYKIHADEGELSPMRASLEFLNQLSKEAATDINLNADHADLADLDALIKERKAKQKAGKLQDTVTALETENAGLMDEIKKLLESDDEDALTKIQELRLKLAEVRKKLDAAKRQLEKEGE